MREITTPTNKTPFSPETRIMGDFLISVYMCNNVSEASPSCLKSGIPDELLEYVAHYISKQVGNRSYQRNFTPDLWYQVDT